MSELSDWMKSGKTQPITESDGGYLIPEVMRFPRRTWRGWLARVVRHPYGWKYVRVADELRRMAREAGAYK